MIFRHIGTLFVIIYAVLVCTPALAQVQAVPTQNPGSGTQIPGVPTQSPGKSEQLINPIEAKDIIEFITDIIGILLVFAVPIIVLYIMYAGYLFVTARGDESQISTAKSAITWAVIGGVIVLATELIIQIIKNTVLSLQ